MSTEFGHLDEQQLRERCGRLHELHALDGSDDHDWRYLLRELPGDTPGFDGEVAELVAFLEPYSRARDGDTLTDVSLLYARILAVIDELGEWNSVRLTYACALAGWRHAQLELAAIWARLASEQRELALEVCRRVPVGSPTPHLASRLEYRAGEAAVLAVGWAAVAGGRRAVHWRDPVPLSVHARTIGTEVAATLWSPKADAKPTATDRGGREGKPAASEYDEGSSTVVVLRPIAGSATYSREVAGAVRDLAGRDLLLALAPSAAELRRVRRDLAKGWPHAVSVVDALLSDVVPGKPLRLRPTLLVGPPGSGKSRLLRALTDALCLPSTTLDAAACADMALTGSPRRWSHSYPSLPLATIMEKSVANPAVILDELEKAGRSSAGSLHDPLLGLLERDTARRWRDQFVDAEVDLSWVVWLCTGNTINGLPGPLVNRLRVLKVPSPGPEHIPALASTLLDDLLQERQVDRRLEPPLDAVELNAVTEAFALSRTASLRDLRRVVEAALDARSMAPKH